MYVDKSCIKRFKVKTHLVESPIIHSLNVSPTLKLETTEMSPLLRADSGCSLLIRIFNHYK